MLAASQASPDRDAGQGSQSVGEAGGGAVSGASGFKLVGIGCGNCCTFPRCVGRAWLVWSGIVDLLSFSGARTRCGLSERHADVEIHSPLGAGGMGEVYRAFDTRLNREVAIKVLPESVSADPERLRRFEQEARAAAALKHPNILAVYQMATHEGASYMVTELLEGETLRERLNRGPIPLRDRI